MPKSIQVNIRIPAELHERLEQARGHVPRTDFVLRLLTLALTDQVSARADVLRYAHERGLDPYAQGILMQVLGPLPSKPWPSCGVFGHPPTCECDNED